MLLKLQLHPVEILGGNGHNLTVIIRENSVLPAHQILPRDPVFHINFLNFIARANYIDNAKTASQRNVDVTLVVVLWEDVAAGSVFQKVDATDVITLEKHVLLVHKHNWHHQRADPGQK